MIRLLDSILSESAYDNNLNVHILTFSQQQTVAFLCRTSQPSLRNFITLTCYKFLL